MASKEKTQNIRAFSHEIKDSEQRYHGIFKASTDATLIYNKKTGLSMPLITHASYMDIHAKNTCSYQGKVYPVVFIRDITRRKENAAQLALYRGKLVELAQEREGSLMPCVHVF